MANVRSTNLPLVTALIELLGHKDEGGGAKSLGRLALAWQDYTPVLTSAGGTLGTYTINSARYIRVGWHVTVTFDITITSAGSSPTGDVKMTLPVAPKSANCGSVQGRESTGPKGLAGIVDGVNARALVSFYDGTTATGNGKRLIGTITYEAA
jgi:hypothetical protein